MVLASLRFNQIFVFAPSARICALVGPPARGRQKVAETLERAASQLREGKALGFERISEYATAELAYIVEIERYHGRAGTSEAAPHALRVTTVFRREDGEWRIVHRHADPITGPRPPESIIRDDRLAVQNA